MITVRFPSGFSVQYNSARYVTWGGDGTSATLWTSKADKEAGKFWVATVNIGCGALIEFVSPCRTYNAAREESESVLKSQIEQLRKEVRSLGRKVGKVSK